MWFDLCHPGLIAEFPVLNEDVEFTVVRFEDNVACLYSKPRLLHES